MGEQMLTHDTAHANKTKLERKKEKEIKLFYFNQNYFLLFIKNSALSKIK